MTPLFSILNLTNCLSGDSESCSENPLRFVFFIFSYFSNGLFVNFASAMRFTFYAPPFFNHVLHILKMCSEKNVRWPHAIPDIAFMEDMKPVRDGSEMEYPRSAVNIHFLSIHDYISIPIWKKIATPNPARPKFLAFFWSILVNSRPESFLKCLKSGCAGNTLVLHIVSSFDYLSRLGVASTTPEAPFNLLESLGMERILNAR